MLTPKYGSLKSLVEDFHGTLGRLDERIPKDPTILKPARRPAVKPKPVMESAPVKKPRAVSTDPAFGSQYRSQNTAMRSFRRLSGVEIVESGPPDPGRVGTTRFNEDYLFSSMGNLEEALNEDEGHHRLKNAAETASKEAHEYEEKHGFPGFSPVHVLPPEHMQALHHLHGKARDAHYLHAEHLVSLLQGLADEHPESPVIRMIIIKARKVGDMHDGAISRHGEENPKDEPTHSHRQESVQPWRDPIFESLKQRFYNFNGMLPEAALQELQAVYADEPVTEPSGPRTEREPPRTEPEAEPETGPQTEPTVEPKQFRVAKSRSEHAKVGSYIFRHNRGQMGRSPEREADIHHRLSREHLAAAHHSHEAAEQALQMGNRRSAIEFAHKAMVHHSASEHHAQGKFHPAFEARDALEMDEYFAS